MTSFLRRLIIASPVALLALASIVYHLATQYAQPLPTPIYLTGVVVAIVATIVLSRILRNGGAQ